MRKGHDPRLVRYRAQPLALLGWVVTTVTKQACLWVELILGEELPAMSSCHSNCTDDVINCILAHEVGETEAGDSWSGVWEMGNADQIPHVHMPESDLSISLSEYSWYRRRWSLSRRLQETMYIMSTSTDHLFLPTYLPLPEPHTALSTLHSSPVTSRGNRQNNLCKPHPLATPTHLGIRSGTRAAPSGLDSKHIV